MVPEEQRLERKKAGSRRDDELMARISSGDERAAAELVDLYLPLLLGLAGQMLGNRAEAEEIAQESFLKLWQFADKWQPRRALIATWLHRVAANLCIDRLRSRRTGEIKAEALKAEKLLDGTQQQWAGALQHSALEEKHMRQRVNAAIDLLPARQKLALALCHFQNMSQKEAANVMDISEHALESLLARSRKALRASLAGEWKQLLPEQVPPGNHGQNKISKRESK